MDNDNNVITYTEDKEHQKYTHVDTENNWINSINSHHSGIMLLGSRNTY